MTTLRQTSRKNEAEYSLFQQLKPEVMADPYPLYRKMREHEPVHWDPYMASWVVTTYAECVTVLSKYQAARTPTPEHLDAMGRSMCAAAFSPKRMELLRQAIEDSANDLVDKVAASGKMDLIRDFASPFPSVVLATLMGLPVTDCMQLKKWATDVSELIGNFEHNPDRIKQLVTSLEEIRDYLTTMVTVQRSELREGVLTAMLEADVNGVGIPLEDLVANAILMCAGGLEEPGNLIGCGMYSMLQRPEQLTLLREHPEIAATATEELMRFESPTQHTGRLAPEDVALGGKQIRKGQLVTAVVAAANRDPLRFIEPDRLDLQRADNRHLAFGWAAHYCIGAPLARLTGQAAFRVLLSRLPEITLVTTKPEWRGMAALRGIVSLQVEFDAQAATALQGNRLNVQQ